MASSVRAATRLCSFYRFTSSRHNVSSGFSWSCRLCSSRPVRSSLYEHVLEGYSRKPKLDMQRVCEETDTVKAEVENRKGDLRAANVGVIISVWMKLQKVQKEISDLEMRKNVISAKVRALVDEHDKCTLASCYKLLVHKEDL